MALTKISTGMLKQDAASSDLNIDAGTLYIDVSNNRVGVNNTSPDTTFEVSSSTAPTLRISNGGGTSPNPKLEFFRQAGVTATFEYDVANKNIFIKNEFAGTTQFHIGGSERMRIDSSGNVGIGATPDDSNVRLHIADSSIYGAIIKLDATHTNGKAFKFQATAASDSMGGGHFVIDDVDAVARRLTLFSNGNVGIGTTTGTPASILHVSGSTGITLGAITGNIWQTTAIKAIDEGANYKGTLAFYTHAHAGAAGAPTERMRIDSSGRVGIGITPASGAKLHVDGHIYLTAGDAIYADFFRPYAGTLATYGSNTSTEHYFLGQVGIGTNSPGNSLEIQHGTIGTGNGSNNTLALRYNSTTLYGQHYMDANGIYHILADASGVAGGNMQLDADTTIRFATGSTPTERMRIDSSGDLIIGGTSSGANDAVSISNTGYIQAIINGDTAAYFNRRTSDGEIIRVQKDGSTVGSIANDSTSLVVTGSSTGLKFGSAAIWPTTGGGVTNSNGAKDLGASTVKFKDLYLNGYAYVGALKTNASVESVSNLTFWVANVGEAMRIEQGTGNVGIGTTSPTMPLSVQAASNAYAISMHGRSDGYSELYGASNDGSTKYSFLQSHSAQTKLYTLVNTPLLFGTNSTERMRINSSGNVVINKNGFSSLPTGSKLNIFGDGITLRLDGSSNTTKSILFRQTGVANPGEVYADGSLRFRTEDASTRITFHTNSSGSDNERMRIDSSGNVGIGTTSPSTSLHIERTSGNATQLVNATANNTRATIETKAKTSGGVEVRGVLGSYGDATKVDIGTLSNHNLSILTNNTERVRFMASGNVGIGDTNPQEKLQINGNLRMFSAGYPLIDIGITTSNYFRFLHDNPNDIFKIGKNGAATLNIAGSGNVGIGTDSPTQKLEVTGTALVENAKLKAIAESNTDTAVDVFVYDTRKDSDGGAWRKRTQNTSWYNETSGSNRSSRKEFPCVAVLAFNTSQQLFIYDGDDPELSLWAKYQNFTQDSGAFASITAINGSIYCGQAASNSAYSGNGYFQLNFAVDYFFSNISSIFSTHRQGRAEGLLTSYNYKSRGDRTTPLYGLVAYQVTDIAVTVLPNAPIDADTGLPVPTIAVATDGGVSIIKDNGTVVDIVSNTIQHETPRKVKFVDDKVFWVAGNNYDNAWSSVNSTKIPTGDITTPYYSVTTANALVSKYTPKEWNVANHAGDLLIPINMQSPRTGALIELAKDEELIIGGEGSDDHGTVVKVVENLSDPESGMIAQIASDFNTGYQVGDIKLAALSDTDTTNVTAGTQPDRSYNNNALSVSGTVTKTAVATGADLVAYSGFSSNNYLQQPYNADLQFGTGDFSIACWVKAGTNESYRRFISIQDPSGQQGNNDAINIKYAPYSSNGQIYAYLGTAEGVITTANNQAANVWHQVILTRKSSTYYLYFNGALVDSIASTRSKGSTSHVLRVGGGAEGGEVFSDGSIALVRISKTAPSEEQIKKMYNDEKHLFATNAKATLYGSSDAVTALAYDDDTELLHVGTSAGRSVFQGLNRVDNTTDAVGAAISASNGFIVEE